MVGNIYNICEITLYKKFSNHQIKIKVILKTLLNNKNKNINKSTMF